MSSYFVVPGLSVNVIATPKGRFLYGGSFITCICQKQKPGHNPWGTPTYYSSHLYGYRVILENSNPLFSVCLVRCHPLQGCYTEFINFKLSLKYAVKTIVKILG